WGPHAGGVLLFLFCQQANDSTPLFQIDNLDITVILFNDVNFVIGRGYLWMYYIIELALAGNKADVNMFLHRLIVNIFLKGQTTHCFDFQQVQEHIRRTFVLSYVMLFIVYIIADIFVFPTF
ncbi:hypothetical protein ACJX0J_033309, partial [Zea mays]